MIEAPEGWIPLKDAVRFIEDNLMTNGSSFALENWEYKYTNIRVDMRTGSAIIQPANHKLNKPSPTNDKQG